MSVVKGNGMGKREKEKRSGGCVLNGTLLKRARCRGEGHPPPLSSQFEEKERNEYNEMGEGLSVLFLFGKLFCA